MEHESRDDDLQQNDHDPFLEDFTFLHLHNASHSRVHAQSDVDMIMDRSHQTFRSFNVRANEAA